MAVVCLSGIFLWDGGVFCDVGQVFLVVMARCRRRLARLWLGTGRASRAVPSVERGC
jgi:hypothetical protein